jgi:hypothetical protein
MAAGLLPAPPRSASTLGRAASQPNARYTPQARPRRARTLTPASRKTSAAGVTPATDVRFTRRNGPSITLAASMAGISGGSGQGSGMSDSDLRTPGPRTLGHLGSHPTHPPPRIQVLEQPTPRHTQAINTPVVPDGPTWHGVCTLVVGSTCRCFPAYRAPNWSSHIVQRRKSDLISFPAPRCSVASPPSRSLLGKYPPAERGGSSLGAPQRGSHGVCRR